MDTNALYYTLSTIAQSIAAAFGLLAAFVLFRLQSLESALREGTANPFFEGDYFTPQEYVQPRSLRNRREYAAFLAALAEATAQWKLTMATKNVTEVVSPWRDGESLTENLKWTAAAGRAGRRLAARPGHRS